MKQKIAIILSIILPIFLVSLLVYAANTFPTTLNDWEEDDVIESAWADSLENAIGVTNSAVTTSHDYLIKNSSSSLYLLNKTDSGFIVGNGTAYVLETGATARTSMGLGTTDNVTFKNLTITYLETVATSTITDATSTNIYATQIGINSEYFTDLTGTNLTNVAGVLTASGDGPSNWSFVSADAVNTTSSNIGIILDASSTADQLTIRLATSTNSTSTWLYGATITDGTFTVTGGAITGVTGLSVTYSTTTGTLVIPVNASLSLVQSGQFGYDTTTGQLRIHDGTADRVVATEDKAFSFTVETPVDADEIPNLFKAPYGMTITQIDCVSDPAAIHTAIDINIFEADANGDSTTTIFDASLTVGNTNSATTTFANAAIDANDWVGAFFDNASGTISWIGCTGRFRITAD